MHNLQGALKDGLGEDVVAWDMLEPRKFKSLDGCQKTFLRSHKSVDLASHPVVGLVLQVQDAGKFPHAIDIKSLDPFFRASKQGPCLTAIEEDGGDKRLVWLELALFSVFTLKLSGHFKTNIFFKKVFIFISSIHCTKHALRKQVLFTQQGHLRTI